MRKFENETPITDPRQVLRLLSCPYSGRWADAQLKINYGGETFVEVWYSGRESEGSSSRCYQVDLKCATEIRDNGWIEGLPRSGYTSEHEFRLSNMGGVQLSTWSREDQKNALALLIPGTHGWSSLYTFWGEVSLYRNEQWRQGLLFTNPLDEYYVVFLADKTVEKVSREEVI